MEKAQIIRINRELQDRLRPTLVSLRENLENTQTVFEAKKKMVETLEWLAGQIGIPNNDEVNVKTADQFVESLQNEMKESTDLDLDHLIIQIRDEDIEHLEKVLKTVTLINGTEVTDTDFSMMVTLAVKYNYPLYLHPGCRDRANKIAKMVVDVMVEHKVLDLKSIEDRVVIHYHGADKCAEHDQEKNVV